MSRQISIVKAWMWIIGSMLFSSGITYKTVRAHSKYQYRQKYDPAYYLSCILQTGPQKEALQTAYLAELMKISADFPTTFAFFDIKQAEKELLKCPVIQEACVKKIGKDTVYVDYTIRQPIAWLADFQNVAVDSEGYIFPVFPFFTPKNLPEIYLGINHALWNTKIQDKKLELAFLFLNQERVLPFKYKRIDVSKAFEENLGKREIVVVIEDLEKMRFLRLNTKDYEQGFSNYLELRQKIPEGVKVIDLRLSQLAFFN